MCVDVPDARLHEMRKLVSDIEIDVQPRASEREKKRERRGRVT